MKEVNLFRAAIRPMPGNPAHTPGDFSGLWRVVIYERRGVSDATEKEVGQQGMNSTYQEAEELCHQLNREFAGEGNVI
jgi:hypothetical protein